VIARVLRAATLCAACVIAAAGTAVAAQASITIDEVRIHGNHTTPDADVLRIAEIVVGSPLEADTVEAVRARLDASGRFSRVEIRQRQRSIDDPTRIALIIIVSEHVGIRLLDGVDVPRVPGQAGRVWAQTMFLPILDVQDGYGLTYGLRTSVVGGRDSTTRLSVPASWGGTRQLAVEAEHTFAPRLRETPDARSIHAADDGVAVPAVRCPASRITRGITRVAGKVGIWRQEHPFFEQGQLRRHVDGEISYRPVPELGVGVEAGLAAVSFGDVDDRMTRGGVFVEIDTRADPLFPRNAVHARTSWSRVSFAHPEQSGVPNGGRSLWRHDVRGYVGLIGQVVLAGRVQLETSSAALPAYAQPIFGGADTLRGIRAGYAVGDNLWSATLEARVPLSSPLRSTRMGVLAFYDTGAIWNAGHAWRDATRVDGLGGGVFLVNPVFRIQCTVARARGLSTRVHLSTGIAF